MEDQTFQLKDKTLRDHLRVLFRHKLGMLICVATVTVSVFFALKLKTPEYVARVEMLILAEKVIDSPYYRGLTGQHKIERALTQSEIVKSYPVIKRAVKASGIYKFPISYEKGFSTPLKARLLDLQLKRLKEEIGGLPINDREEILLRKMEVDLKKRIKVEPIRDTNLFTIRVRDFSPTQAAHLANVVSRSYIIYDLEQQLAELTLKYGEKHPVVKQLKDSIRALDNNLTKDSLSNLEAIGPATVKIIEQATIPTSPIGSSRKKLVIMAFVMSCILGIILAFILEQMDQTIKSPHDIGQFLKLPMVGFVRKKRGIGFQVVRNVQSRSPYAKSYQALCEQLHILIKDQSLKTLLISSSSSREGNHIVAANLGKYFSENMNYKVLILDVNFRNPKVGKIFWVPKSQCFSHALVGEKPIEKLTKKINPNLTVLAARKRLASPITYLDSPRMEEMLRSFKEEYDLVLITCSNLMNYKDSVLFSSHIDGVTLVIDEGKIRWQAIKTAIKPLIERKVNMLGAVLNKRTFPIPGIIYNGL